MQKKKKLERWGYCWRDENGAMFEWKDDCEMFLEASTLKLYKMVEQISDDEVIISVEKCQKGEE